MTFLMDADTIGTIEATIAEMGRDYGVFAQEIRDFKTASRQYNAAVSASTMNVEECERLYANLEQAVSALVGSSESFDDQETKDAVVDVHRMATAEEIRDSGKIDWDAVELRDCGGDVGRGVFAKKAILKGVRVASYGAAVETSAGNVNSKYRLSYKQFVIDGDPSLSESAGHLGNFFNDARGSTKMNNSRNNVRFSLGHVVVNNRKIPTVWLVTTTSVKAGDQLLVAYGRQFWQSFK